ncbi:unnamed protein product [Fusarium graminearum]|nr:hypothetical protein FG05_11406 [Fusarium graminearum]PCD24419.1 hypothetical protein FGRA07_11079 [Fusarium graminearum]CAF3544617.1 unnamed protein product [Fusarium graminearum]CAG1974392.1 unnamed protein product [Fusarium graminearum]CAG1982185.1 unnamed protein product [Fusarium graminearum]
MGAQISVVLSNDVIQLANAVFNGPGVSVVGASVTSYYQVDTKTYNKGSAGTFTNGPFGIGSGGILSTGWISDAKDPSGTIDHDTGTDGSIYCGSGSTTNGAVLQVEIVVGQGYNGLAVEFVIGTSENLQENADTIGIYLDGVQYAVDTSNNRITVNSEYLQQPLGVTDTEFVRSTMYDHSSPPLLMGLPASPGRHSMVFAICDANNGQKDSALMVKAGACVDCAGDIKLNYKTTTTTVGSTSFVSTIKPFITNSGTVVYGVPVEATTTSEEVYSTTTADVTSYSEEATSTAEVMSTSVESTVAETTTTADALPTSTGASIVTEEPTTTDLPTTTVVSSEESTTTDASSTETDYTTTTVITNSDQSTETSSTVESDTTTTVVTSEAKAISTDVSTSQVSTSTASNTRDNSASTTVAPTMTSSQVSIPTASTLTTIRKPCRP